MTGRDLNMIKGIFTQFVVHGCHYHICENKEYHEALDSCICTLCKERYAHNITWRSAIKEHFQFHTMQHSNTDTHTHTYSGHKYCTHAVICTINDDEKHNFSLQSTDFESSHMSIYIVMRFTF
jgi:hypothetical protein